MQTHVRDKENSVSFKTRKNNFMKFLKFKIMSFLKICNVNVYLNYF